MTALPTITFYYDGLVDAGKKYLPRWEGCLDGAGYVPYLSTISGGIRMYYGVAEIVAGLSLIIFSGLTAHYYNSDDFYKRCTEAADFVVHGVANVARGFIECHRWINLTCLLNDVFVEGRDLRLRYDKSIILWGN